MVDLVVEEVKAVIQNKEVVYYRLRDLNNPRIQFTITSKDRVGLWLVADSCVQKIKDYEQKIKLDEVDKKLPF